MCIMQKSKKFFKGLMMVWLVCDVAHYDAFCMAL